MDFMVHWEEGMPWQYGTTWSQGQRDPGGAERQRTTEAD